MHCSHFKAYSLCYKSVLIFNTFLWFVKGLIIFVRISLQKIEQWAYNFYPPSVCRIAFCMGLLVFLCQWHKKIFFAFWKSNLRRVVLNIGRANARSFLLTVLRAQGIHFKCVLTANCLLKGWLIIPLDS